MKKLIREKAESIIDEIQELIDGTDDLSYISFDMDESDISSVDDVIEYIEDRIREIEIIYFDRATEYLTDTDPSFKTSFEIAENLGYRLKDLNVEILATITCQELALEDLSDIRDDIEELVEDFLESKEE